MHRCPLTPALLLLTVAPACQISLGTGGLSFHESQSREEVHALDLAPGELLTLASEYGDVEVTAASEGPYELRATLSARGRTRDEAQRVLALHSVRLEREAQGTRVVLAGEPLQVRQGGLVSSVGASVEYSARVPPGTRIAARSASGDLELHGPLGGLELETHFGSIHIEAARGDVHAKTSSGEIVAQHLESDTVELATSFGSVLVEHARGSVQASTGSGDLELRGVHGAVRAISSFGTIAVDGVLAALSAASSSGDVRVVAQPGSRVEAPWELASSYGVVLLEVPEDFACELDARTSFGEVACDFPVTIDASAQRGEHHLQGSIGGGGGLVTLSSDSGDVRLKKR